MATSDQIDVGDNSEGSAYECVICLRQFVEPKIISCGHTFCQQCLEHMEITYNRNNTVKTLKCPFCRQTVELPSSGSVRDFPVNFAILQAIERSKIQNLCPQHKLSQDLFCRSCKVCICAECFLKEHKPTWLHKHDVESSKTVADETVEELKLAADKLEVSRLQNTMLETEQEESTVTENAASVIEEIHEQREQLIQEIRLHADELVKIVEIVAEDKKQKLQKIKKEKENLYLLKLETSEKYLAHADEIRKSGLSQAIFNKARDLLVQKGKCNTNEKNNRQDTNKEDDKASKGDSEFGTKDDETTEPNMEQGSEDNEMISSDLAMEGTSYPIGFVKNSKIKRPIEIGRIEIQKPPADKGGNNFREIAKPSFITNVVNLIYRFFGLK